MLTINSNSNKGNVQTRIPRRHESTVRQLIQSMCNTMS